MEIIITILIAAIAVYILYKNITQKVSGKGECDGCCQHCSINKKDSCCK